MPNRSRVASGILSVVIFAAIGGCRERDAAVDPESHHPQVDDGHALRRVPFADVVAASFGVTRSEASFALERHLLGRADGVLAKWPRLSAGGLDLDHPPLVATSLGALVGPSSSKSSCGEVTVVFSDGSVSLRAKLAVPASASRCRGLTRDRHYAGDDALELLEAAIADARVFLPVGLPVVAAN